MQAIARHSYLKRKRKQAIRCSNCNRPIYNDYLIGDGMVVCDEECAALWMAWFGEWNKAYTWRKNRPIQSP